MVHMHVRHVAVAAAMFATAQEQKSGPRLGKERPLVTSRDLGGRSKVEFLPWPDHITSHTMAQTRMVRT